MCVRARYIFWLQVKFVVGADVEFVPLVPTSNNLTRLDISGLTNFVPYYFQVPAVNTHTHTCVCVSPVCVFACVRVRESVCLRSPTSCPTTSL